mmetsp:Transcript_23097/g.60735  ORF Transcript_23097/g.60735 Transcript_23097/m.60735 type:complete len:92 (+) Transcript_23097:811-1086(+)
MKRGRRMDIPQPTLLVELSRGGRRCLEGGDTNQGSFGCASGLRRCVDPVVADVTSVDITTTTSRTRSSTTPLDLCAVRWKTAALLQRKKLS